MKIVSLPYKAKDPLRSFKNKEGKIINLTKDSARNRFNEAKKKYPQELFFMIHLQNLMHLNHI